MSETQNRVLQRVRDLEAIANVKLGEYDHAFLGPITVEWFRNKARAGHASRTHPGVAFNLDYLEAEPELFLASTVPHEVAHVVAAHLARIAPAWVRRNFGGYTPHGKLWKHLMRVWFGATPKRTHSYDTTVTRIKRQRTYPYRCACRTVELSATRHNRSRRGRGYRCGVCHEKFLHSPRNAGIVADTETEEERT